MGKKNIFALLVPEVQMFSNAGVTVSYYSMQGCPHCVRFNPEWEKFENEVKSDKSVKTAKYDARKDEAKVREAGVEGFPTVTITRNGKTDTYEGPRTVKGLLEAIRI